MKKYCEICSLEMNDDYSFQSHLAGKKHLRNVQQKELEKRITERSIFVSPLPKYITCYNLVDFFLQFGAIESYRTGPNHIIIEFKNREPVEYLLNHPVWLNNTKLVIKKRILYNQSPKRRKQSEGNSSTEDTSPTSLAVIKDTFMKEITFDSQLMAFLDAVQLSDDEVETRYNPICTVLDNIFKPIFPNCQTYKFGSTLTGLGFKECDLDIYMDIGAPVCDSKTTSPNAWTTQRIFKEVKKVMYKRNTLFSDIAPIPRAKTPIIKFCYVPTNISCDISFKNGFGVYNSYLIKHCLSLDNRLKPLMILIKYWARQCNLSGCGKISNYALIMLIIFYLQQLDIGILPPLMKFQETCAPKIINGWQVNFNKDTVLPPITNNTSIPQLLHGFFAYYANFEFKTNVVCPFDGLAYPKNDFKDVESLPEYMHRYKEIAITDDLKLNVSKHVCIQDPIELNRNIAASTSLQTMDAFQEYCGIVAQICASASNDQYKNLLDDILSLVFKLENKVQFVINLQAGRFLDVGLPENFYNRIDIIDKEQYRKNNWYFTTFNIVKDIFVRVFKFEVEVLSTDKEAKQRKVEVVSDVHTTEHQQLLLYCKGKECMWRNRKSNQFILDPTLSFLDKEAYVSDKVMEDNNKSACPIKVQLDFVCKFEKKDNPVRVQLTLKNKNSNKKLFKEFGNFVQTKIPKIVDKTLLHMLQFNKHY